MAVYASAGDVVAVCARCFIILGFNNFILLRPENLYVILARLNDLPEDDILNVESCRSMLFVIIVFDVIVQSLVKS